MIGSGEGAGVGVGAGAGSGSGSVLDVSAVQAATTRPNAMAATWMQTAGLEWLYRLLQEPRRLFARYMRYNFCFVTAFLSERFRKMLE